MARIHLNLVWSKHDFIFSPPLYSIDELFDHLLTNHEYFCHKIRTNDFKYPEIKIYCMTNDQTIKEYKSSTLTGTVFCMDYHGQTLTKKFLSDLRIQEVINE